MLKTLTVFILALSLHPEAQQKTGVLLPTVTAYALDKTKTTLPADFSTSLNFLILSFARDQQSAVDSWLSVVSRASSGHDKIQSWVLPVSPSENDLYKWWLNSSMRSSLPADQPAHFTVPLYVNKQQFLRTLEITSEKQVSVLLTDRGGHVLWRDVGPPNDRNKQSLLDFLKSSSVPR